MGLILPNGPSFGRWSDNLGTFSGGLSYGTQYEAGLQSAGVAADASPATLLSALAHDCEYLILGFSGFGSTGRDGSTLLDILYDPAGGTSWTELIADLVVGGVGATVDFAASAAPSGELLTYHFPLWIPAGSTIGVRAKTAMTSALATPSRVVAMVGGDNRNPASWWCGQKVQTVSTFDQNACRGTVITPGSSGSMAGSWTDLGSTLSAAGRAAQWGVQSPAVSVATGQATRFEFGIGGVQIGPPVYAGFTTLEAAARWMPGPLFYDFPAGAQLQVRAGSSSASPQPIDVAAYIVQ